MGWIIQKKWEQINGRRLFHRATMIELFHLLTTTLLSLLLPISVLLLARLSSGSAHYYLFRLSSTPVPPLAQPVTSLFTIFLSANPALLHALVSLVSIATLLQCLSGHTTFSFSRDSSTSPILRPGLCTAWLFLCASQVCVGLGIEGSIAAGVEGSVGPGSERCVLSRLILFVGLHETMLHWSRMVVKPVVDDTIFGVATEEKWADRVAMAVSFGGLWWWRLREEVESLVLVNDESRGSGCWSVEMVGLFLYYLTVVIGMIRVVNGLIWGFMVLLCTSKKAMNADSNRGEDKV